MFRQIPPQVLGTYKLLILRTAVDLRSISLCLFNVRLVAVLPAIWKLSVYPAGPNSLWVETSLSATSRLAYARGPAAHIGRMKWAWGTGLKVPALVCRNREGTAGNLPVALPEPIPS